MRTRRSAAVTPLEPPLGRQQNRDGTCAESRCIDLYNGLIEFPGTDRADTLMAYLPFQESNELATRSALDAFEERLAGRIDLVDHRFDLVDQRFGLVD